MSLSTSIPSGIVASIPSPTQGVWYAGPLPVRAYALFILLGILIAVQLGERRWMQRGGRPGVVLDIAAWAVPFGIVGGRLYHVITSWQPYFGSDGDPIKALYIWEGGLGIWGAVALGGLGAWIGARRAGVLLPPMADALAPGIVLAQAIGRWGNWFNNELYGSRTDLPWGLRIYKWDQDAGHAVNGPDGRPIVLGTFHPTFLYESLWDVGVAVALLWADRRWRLGHGRVFALYVLLYTLGRGWIEALRIDDANKVLGLRVNLWTSLVVGLTALSLLVWSARRRPGRERVVVRTDAAADPLDTGTAAGSSEDDARDVEPVTVVDAVTTDPAPPVTKPEPAPEPSAKAEPKPKPAPEPSAKAGPKPAPEPSAKAEPKPEPKPEPEPKLSAKSGPKADAEPKAEPKATKPVVKPPPKAEPTPDAAAKPEPEPAVTPEPEAKAARKPEAKPEPKAEKPKLEPEAEKPDAKAEKPEPEAEKPEPEAEKSKAEPKAEKPELEPEPKAVKPQPKATEKPEPRTTEPKADEPGPAEPKQEPEPGHTADPEVADASTS